MKLKVKEKYFFILKIDDTLHVFFYRIHKKERKLIEKNLKTTKVEIANFSTFL
jgi:hypothetical protein